MTLYVHTEAGQYLNSQLFLTKSWNTIITKLDYQSIKLERYYEPTLTHSILKKFTGNYREMPDELKDKNPGDKFTDNKYETNDTKFWLREHNKRFNGTRFGLAQWWHDNGQLFTEGEYINGMESNLEDIYLWIMYRSNGEVIEGERWSENKRKYEPWGSRPFKSWDQRREKDIKKSEKKRGR